MPIDLYSVCDSTPAAMVRTVAKEIGVNLNLCNLDLSKNEQMEPAYMEVSKEFVSSVAHKITSTKNRKYRYN